MKIVNFEDQSTKDELYNHIANKRLIPLIGSGFSRGSISKRGQVPSGLDMKRDMIEKLEQFDSSFIGTLNNESFPKVASFYEKHIERNIKFKYLEDYFTQVRLKGSQARFVQADWPYIYTLNLDDAIEGTSTGNYTVILPCQELNEDFLEKQYKCLFKLHGDALDVIKYKKSDYVFSQNQYIKSLESNQYLLGLLRNDLLSNNIIFIGCSLDTEIDLLSQVVNLETTIGKKTTYFLTTNAPDFRMQSQLEDYGVDTVIVVNNYDTFYNEVADLCTEASKLGKDQLDEYCNLKFINENNAYESNINYLFESNYSLRHFKKKVINLPYYFIDRDKTSTILAQMDKTTIQILYGHRICGKTFCLFSIMNKIHNRNTYYFPSTVSLNTTSLNEVLSKKDSVILFDSNCLNEVQIKSVVSNLKQLKANRTTVLIAVNTSDRDIINIIAASDSIDIFAHELQNKFSREEINQLNPKISYNTLPKFDLKKTILDNIFTVASLIKSGKIHLKGQPTILNNIELVTLIMLATNEYISSFDTVQYKLVEDIGKITDDLQPIIQFEYTLQIERASHSGFKIIPNAKYWILKTIGDFASQHKNHKQIVDAYRYIATCVRSNVKDEHKSSRKILDYISFDTINDIFSRHEHGSAKLINEIYDAMNEFLSNYPQYYHQRAKCKLFFSHSNINGLQEALQYARKAKNDLEVTANLKSPTVQHALSHTTFTISRILGRLANITDYRDYSILIEAIDGYYISLSDKHNEIYANYLLQKASTYKDKEKNDFSTLVSTITTKNILLPDQAKDKVGTLITKLRDLA